MKLLFRKKPHYQLMCVRPDGTTSVAKVGTHVAYHDLAHVVVELKGRFQNGFFGLVSKGFSLDTLSEPSVFKKLEREWLVIEVLVRGLGAMLMGACKPNDYESLVREELGELYDEVELNLTEHIAHEWLSAYEVLLAKWERLEENETLVIELNPTCIQTSVVS